LELGPWTAAREYELITLKCHDVSLKNGRNGMVFYKFDVCSGCSKKIRKVVPSTLTYPHTIPKAMCLGELLINKHPESP
jgi:hypothetical protein